MSQQITYIELLRKLSPFHFQIFSSVKKDCKSEHLALDNQFLKKHFTGKLIAKITVEDLLLVYPKVIDEGHEQLAEFIANRWLLKHMDLYHLFENELKKINPQFDQITEISECDAKAILEMALKDANPVTCYIFCTLNLVAIPLGVLKDLEEKALSYIAACSKSLEQSAEKCTNHSTLEDVQKICEKYEKKLAGMQKKYVTDTGILKKQVSILQQRIHELNKSST